MDKTLLKKGLLPKTKDYTYAIAFFLIFSFFIFYIIRPNLITVFEINTKIDQLKMINKQYEQQIDKIIEIQSKVETAREDFIILREAIAAKPDINKILADLDISSGDNNLKSDKIIISNINLKDTGSGNKLKSFIVDIKSAGSFEDTMEYVKKIFTQRRLKYIPKLELDQENTSSESGNILIKMEVEGFYL